MRFLGGERVDGRKPLEGGGLNALILISKVLWKLWKVAVKARLSPQT